MQSNCQTVSGLVPDVLNRDACRPCFWQATCAASLASWKEAVANVDPVTVTDLGVAAMTVGVEAHPASATAASKRTSFFIVTPFSRSVLRAATEPGPDQARNQKEIHHGQ